MFNNNLNHFLKAIFRLTARRELQKVQYFKFCDFVVIRQYTLLGLSRKSFLFLISQLQYFLRFSSLFQTVFLVKIVSHISDIISSYFFEKKEKNKTKNNVRRQGERFCSRIGTSKPLRKVLVKVIMINSPSSYINLYAHV